MFDRSDIRPAMDVFTRDNVYLGTVLAIIPGDAPAARPAPVEEAMQGSAVSGEMLGPMPTKPLGNGGPSAQSAAQHYATTPDDAPSLGRGALTVGRWYGLLGTRRIPLADVQTVSLERVVLRLRRDELR